MNKSNFTLSQSIVISIIFFNILAVSNIPGFFFSEKYNYILQIFVFLLVIFIDIKVSGTFGLKRFKFSTLNMFSFLVITSFLLSSFYFNLNNNLDAFSIAKLVTFPIIVYFFFRYLPEIIYNHVNLYEKLLNYWLYFSLTSIFVSLVVLILGLDVFMNVGHSSVGYFYYTNIFAFIFTFTIPILIYKYFTKQLTIIPFLVLLIPSFVCLLFTFSRAGYIGALVSLLILVYKRSRTLFVISVFFFLLISSTIVLQFATAKGSASAFSRAQVMMTGYDMIFNHGMKHFLWGYGVINSKEIFVQELGSNYGASRLETGPHNFVLTLGIQFGMILTLSVVLYLILLLIKVQYSVKRKLNYPNYFKVNLAVSVIAGILIECILEDIVVYPEFFVMPIFLIFVGYLNCYVNDRSGETNEKAL